jgi:hypothetical protein
MGFVLLFLVFFISGCTIHDDWSEVDKFEYEQRYKEKETQTKEREQQYLHNISTNRF